MQCTNLNLQGNLMFCSVMLLLPFRTLITGMASGSIVAFNIDFNRWHYEHQNGYWREMRSAEVRGQRNIYQAWLNPQRNNSRSVKEIYRARRTNGRRNIRSTASWDRWELLCSDLLLWRIKAVIKTKSDDNYA